MKVQPALVESFAIVDWTVGVHGELHLVSEAACQDDNPIGWANPVDLLNQQTLRANLEDLRLV
jgi:hypothetical protein